MATLRPWFHIARSVDWLLALPIVFLLTESLILMYGISINETAPDPGLFRRQLMYGVISLGVFFFMSNLNYRMWSVYGKFMYIGGFLVLSYVLLFGVTIRGTTGWVSVGFASFQPVEFAKIALLIFLAKYFSDHARLFFLWRHILITGAATAVYLLLVLRQPDLGSAMVIMGMWFLMLLTTGIPRRHLITLIIFFAVTAIVAWLLVLEPYQKQRVLTFLNPQSDVLGAGYNVRQSIIAVGSGQIFGRGFGLGSQSQLKFLPEPETDFIFAVLAEEFGFIGIVLTLAALLVLLYRLLYIATKTDDNFAAYLALGLASLVVVQSFINIGMNIGIAPVTGIPLPFLSAGGSSLLSLCVAFGLISSIVRDQRTLSKH